MRWMLLIAMMLVLAGCSSPYQPKGFRGGYSETKLADDVYKVRFRGNGYTSAEKVEDFVLYRSAELARLNGYPFFAVVNESTGVKTSYYVQRGQYGSTVTPINKPGASLTIQLLRKKQPGLVYSAREIIKNIGAKYGIGPK